MMMTTERVTSLASSRDDLFTSGSLPLKKRKFEPFKTKSIAEAHRENSDYILSPLFEAISSVESGCSITGPRSNPPVGLRALAAAVSRDADESCSQLESRFETDVVNKWITDECTQNSDSSVSEDCKLYVEVAGFLRKGIPGKPSQQQNVAHPNLTKLSTPQDRRYTDSSIDTRCLATTTRGRKCAYIAVGNTRYCNMHAAYDTNPPKLNSKTRTCEQERGRAWLGEKAMADHEDITRCFTNVLASSPSLLSEDSMDIARVTTSSDGETPCKSSKKAFSSLCASSEANEMHTESSYPLLSMIPTDLWFQKTVRVAVGPLQGSFGRVLKWGNGWVSVNIPGIGMHNRRSFELYLHSYDEMDEVVTEKEPHPRSICRKAGSPSLQHAPTLSRTWKGYDPRDIGAVAVTPRSTMTSPTTVNDSSNKNRNELKTVNTVSPPVSLHHRVSEISNIPSVDSIVLSADTSKGKFGMLYGTAALERSRRSIHRPSRYEDTEMFDNIHGPRKRSRSLSDEIATENHSRSGFSI